MTHPPADPPSPGPLTSGRILAFWLPLAAMWVMMAVEGPALAAMMARLPHPELNLAAYGITFSLALLVESPIIMLLTAATALPRGSHSYRRLLVFTHALVATLTLLHLVAAIPAVYRFLAGTLIGAPGEVVELSRVAFLLMTPWTASIAYRRLWQGVLIRFRRTRVVPFTIGGRLVVTVSVMLAGLLVGRYRGAVVGAVALSLGVITAALLAYAFARSTIRQRLSRSGPGDEPLGWRELLQFYVPLALTPLIMLAARPLHAVVLARAPEPLVSLAVWPVIISFLFLGMSVAMSYQEAVVVLLTEPHSYAALRRFALLLAVGLTGLFGLAALSPLARIWYAQISGLPPQLVRFALAPTAILAVVPGANALVAWRRGVLVHAKRTRFITYAVVVNVTVLMAVMFGGLRLLDLPGATLVALAMSCSVLAELGYLAWAGRRAARRVAAAPAPGGGLSG